MLDAQMFRRGPRWSPDIKNGRGLLLVDLLDAQMFRRGPRWSPDIKNGRGRLLVDLLDAHAHGEPKMELGHHHGGGRLLVDLFNSIGKVSPIYLYLYRQSKPCIFQVVRKSKP